MDYVNPLSSPYLTGDPSETEGLIAKAGVPIETGTAIATKEAVIEALHTVYDPEIPVDIYELGLIYDLNIAEDGTIAISMTLTTPACPVAGELPQEVADAAASVPGTGEVTVALTWEPPWTMENMSEDAKIALGFF